MTLSRRSSLAELNLASTAQKTLDREIFEAMEHRALVQSGAKQQIAYGSSQLPKEFRKGSTISKFTENDVHRMLTENPCLQSYS